MINCFRGKYYFLSNFYDAKVTYDGLTYLNNEAAFQSAKLLDKKERVKFTDMSPGDAKRVGRRVELRSDWEEIKFDILYDIVKAKFDQNENLRLQLLQTNKEYLEEGNTWHDNTYGNCICPRCKRIEGINELGKILMQIRVLLIRGTR